MFLDELFQVIVVGTNHFDKAKIAARESARPDKIHRPWIDVTFPMMAFLGLAVNMSVIHQGDARDVRVVFHRCFLRLYNFHYILSSVHRLRKVLYHVQHLRQQYQRFYVPERDLCG